MVEIKSGLLKDAHGQFDGMVIYHKRGKTFGRKFPSYDGNAGSPTRAHQNTRLSSVVTLVLYSLSGLHKSGFGTP